MIRERPVRWRQSVSETIPPKADPEWLAEHLPGGPNALWNWGRDWIKNSRADGDPLGRLQKWLKAIARRSCGARISVEQARLAGAPGRWGKSYWQPPIFTPAAATTRPPASRSAPAGSLPLPGHCGEGCRCSDPAGYPAASSSLLERDSGPEGPPPRRRRLPE